MREPVDATPLITISNAGIDMDLANDVANTNEGVGNNVPGSLRLNDNNEQRSLILSPSLINFENSDSNINTNGGASFNINQGEQMTTGETGSGLNIQPTSSTNDLAEAVNRAAANSDDSESESAFTNAIRKRFPNSRRDLN